MTERALRCGVFIVMSVAVLVATGGLAGAQDTTVPEPPQASDTVSGLPTISGTLEDDTIRVLIENCEVGTAIVRIDGIEVATVTITMDLSGAEAPDVEAAATGEVVVAIPEGATPPYDVEVECSNGTATTVVDVPTVPDPDDGAQTPGGGGTGDDGDGALPVTGGGSTLVPLARGAALAVAAGAILVLVARQRREPASAA